MKLIKFIPHTAFINWVLVDEDNQIVIDASNNFKEFINKKYMIKHDKYMFILKDSEFIQISENIESIT